MQHRLLFWSDEEATWQLSLWWDQEFFGFSAAFARFSIVELVMPRFMGMLLIGVSRWEKARQCYLGGCLFVLLLLCNEFK